MRTRVIFGPPGTGKTTRLVSLVEEALAGGVDPARVALVTFSRAAARTARARVVAATGLEAESLPWFRTLHSAAYRRAGLKRADVMSRRDWLEFGDWAGYVFSAHAAPGDGARYDPRKLGDACSRVHALSQSLREPLEVSHARLVAEGMTGVPLSEVERYARMLEEFKRGRYLLDFPDFLELPEARRPLEVDLAVVDEAQDLTPQQWAYARSLLSQAGRVVLAGDDDQRVYEFSGATAEPLLSLRAEREVLPQSYRLPRAVHAVAARVVAGIAHRAAKPFAPRDAAGLVEWIQEPASLDLGSGTWLLLARAQHMLPPLVELARRAGVLYHYEGRWSNEDDYVRAVLLWERRRRGERLNKKELEVVARYAAVDAPAAVDWMVALGGLTGEQREYVRGLRRRNEPLRGPGRVRVCTVHESKGAEAENVYLHTATTRAVAHAVASGGGDAERRVLYVALTRASERLFLGAPRGRNSWSIEV